MIEQRVRRFLPPWKVEQIPCGYKVIDAEANRSPTSMAVICESVVERGGRVMIVTPITDFFTLDEIESAIACGGAEITPFECVAT